MQSLQNSVIETRTSKAAQHVPENGIVRSLLEKYPTFGREKETGLLGALDT